MTKPHSMEDELRIIKRLIAAALAVAVGIGGFFYWSTTSQTNDIIKTRTEARLAECHRDNNQSDRAVVYAHDQALVLVNAAHANPKDPTPASYIAAAEKAARHLFPKRSCTRT